MPTQPTIAPCANTIPPGLPVPEFMRRLEEDIETRSDALLVEAGFKQP